MANYLLLRDNREKGPYSLNELLELGLKPYDLVWIEGKAQPGVIPVKWKN